MVFDHSLDNPDLRGMGTTLTAAALVNEDGRDVIALVNVGDSRSYRYHDGQLTQITVDHSLAEEMVRSGEISETEAAVHPHRHILTRALGVADDVVVDLWRIQPARGDRFLLCSDGLTNELDDTPDRRGPGDGARPTGGRRPPGPGRPHPRGQRQHHRGGRRRGASARTTESDVPAVAAVAADFPSARPTRRAAGRGGRPSAPAPEEDVALLPGPEPLKPSFRDRWRARRKARRAARGRRLITIRTVLFVVILGAIVYAAFYAVRWYDTNAYYVQVNNNELMIYHGRIGGGVLYKPVVVERTGFTTADVPPYTVAPAGDRGPGGLAQGGSGLRGQPGGDPEADRRAPRTRPPSVARRHRPRCRCGAVTTTTGAP